MGGDEPRPTNRATVKSISEETDHKGEPAHVIEITGVQGIEAEIYVYNDRDEVILFGSAEKEERVLEIQHPPR